MRGSFIKSSTNDKNHHHRILTIITVIIIEAVLIVIAARIKGGAKVFLLGVLVIVLMLGSCLYVAEDGHEGFEAGLLFKTYFQGVGFRV